MEEKGYPADDRYYVLKQDESLGPFDVEELLEQIEIGAFSYDDVCLRVGDTACSRLREILDWDDATQLESVEASHEANQWDQRDSPMVPRRHLRPLLLNPEPSSTVVTLRC